MVDANRRLYKVPEVDQKGVAVGKGEHPDHIVVIKYVPVVGDSKRAIDEYYSEIFYGCRSTTVDYLIMHKVRPHPRPMHYEIYARRAL